jgi:hypothetical protein
MLNKDEFALMEAIVRYYGMGRKLQPSSHDNTTRIVAQLNAYGLVDVRLDGVSPTARGIAVCQLQHAVDQVPPCAGTAIGSLRLHATQLLDVLLKR